MSFIGSAWDQLSIVGRILGFLWLLEMISVPVWKWLFGERAERLAISAGVLLQVSLVVSILLPAWGVPRTLVVWLAVSGLGWLSELIGSRTGIPYGPYTYTAVLQPQFFRVPVVVPLAWMMMMPPAWAVGASISGLFSLPSGGWLLAVLGALAFTSWDLFLDPQMVSWDFWRWHTKGGYFGIPWLNYAGWFIVAALITFVVQPVNLPFEPLLLVFLLTWLLQTIAQLFFWKLPGPAIAGFFGMGIFGGLSLLFWTFSNGTLP